MASITKRTIRRGKRRSDGTWAPGSVWEVRYRLDTGRERSRTFRTEKDAVTFAASVTVDLARGSLRDPHAGRITLRDYSATWLASRPQPLRPRTAETYRSVLDRHILGAVDTPSAIDPLGDARLGSITPAKVRAWWASLDAAGVGAAARAKAYRLLRAMLATAEADELIGRNPCRIPGAGTEECDERPVIPPDTVWELADAIDDRYRALVLLAGFCCLRRGELLGLRRRHVVLTEVPERRAAVHVLEQLQELQDGTIVIGPPKTDAGRRTVAVPSSVATVLAEHLGRHTAPPADAFVFAATDSQPLRPKALQRAWDRARANVELPAGFRFHDLRHTGATLAAQHGASIAELQRRVGHASARAALIYQHATDDRDRALADAIDRTIAAPEPARVVPMR